VPQTVQKPAPGVRGDPHVPQLAAPAELPGPSAADSWRDTGPGPLASRPACAAAPHLGQKARPGRNSAPHDAHRPARDVDSCAGAPVWPASTGEPHTVQKAIPGRSGSPHDAQGRGVSAASAATCGSPSGGATSTGAADPGAGVPHFEQKARPGRSSAPQDAHRPAAGPVDAAAGLPPAAGASVEAPQLVQKVRPGRSSDPQFVQTAGVVAAGGVDAATGGCAPPAIEGVTSGASAGTSAGCIHGAAPSSSSVEPAAGSAAAAGSPSFPPHSIQKAFPAGTVSPHDGHWTVSAVVSWSDAATLVGAESGGEDSTAGTSPGGADSSTCGESAPAPCSAGRGVPQPIQNLSSGARGFPQFWQRASVGTAGGPGSDLESVTAVPHSVQNSLPGIRAAPQERQVATGSLARPAPEGTGEAGDGAASVEPHLVQKDSPSRTVAPQFEQTMERLPASPTSLWQPFCLPARRLARRSIDGSGRGRLRRILSGMRNPPPSDRCDRVATPSGPGRR
jgi:hypothetical protein